MKEEILKFFKTDRSFNGAIALIIKYSNKISLKKQLNVQAESPHLKGVIFEELREIAGISHQEFDGIMKSKLIQTSFMQPISKDDEEKIINEINKINLPEKPEKKKTQPKTGKTKPRRKSAE